ncbi:hypothetical protein BG004_003909 [Podila humilis]|nr:hypothetical protein BG004_003909 [Podila humilis]
MAGNSNGTPASFIVKRPTPVYKDSISHPINVSFILPPWLTPVLNEDLSVPGQMDFLTFARQEASVLYTLPPAHVESFAKKRFPNGTWRPRGNMGLSSCPGKKVRLDGPVNGRAKIVRDLDLDFDRLQKLGFTRVVCCLFDEELEMLGSPFPKYLEAANNHGLDVVRIPMVEGSTPYSFAELDLVLDRIDEVTKTGHNVLVHCRGGVGRAAVVACCWLLRLSYFERYSQAIDFVRTQRSVKAIETKEQEHFVQGFQYWTKGGQSREKTGMAFELEIQKRINWAEASMAESRRAAALMNLSLLARPYHSESQQYQQYGTKHTNAQSASSSIQSNGYSHEQGSVLPTSSQAETVSPPLVVPTEVTHDQGHRDAPLPR